MAMANVVPDKNRGGVPQHLVGKVPKLQTFSVGYSPPTTGPLLPTALLPSVGNTRTQCARSPVDEYQG